MKFIHAIVFTPDENPPAYWFDACFGDYIVHALYSVEKERILILDDNCHAPVEDMINSFLIGTQFAIEQKEEIQVTECYVIADDPYSKYEVAEKLKNKDFMEVI